MSDRLTDSARKTVVLSQEEARRLRHDYIGTEHLLLGIVREGEGTGFLILGAIGLTPQEIRSRVEAIVGMGAIEPSGHIPFSPELKKVLELALRESNEGGWDHVGSEHFVAGLLREGEGIAAQVLRELGVNLPAVRRLALDLSSANPNGGSLSGLATPPQAEAVPQSAQRATASESESNHPVVAIALETPAVPRRIDYLNLEIMFRDAGDSAYTVRIIHSPAGQTGDQELVLPFSPLELENFLLRVGHAPRRVRRIDDAQTKAVKEFGGKLYDTLFRDELKSIFLRSLSEASSTGAGLRIRLRLSDTPALATIPWEFLYDRLKNRFLGLSEHTPIVRFLDLADPPRPLVLPSTLNILVVIPSPPDLMALDSDEEWSRLSAALSPLIQANTVYLHRLVGGTAAALRRALRQTDWHVLHFIGHGEFNSSIEDGVLFFEGQNGRSNPMTGEDLGMLLHDHNSLRLVVLNACDSARTDEKDPFSGSAPELIRQGIPAVVAMQFELSDGAAISLTYEIYSAIADGYPLEAALAAARKAVYIEGNHVEWGTPVLYLRTTGHEVFATQRPQFAGQPAG